MKKIISLLFIRLFMFFAEIKTVSNNIEYDDVMLEQVLQNSNVIINKPFILKEQYEQKFITITENKINVNFDYAYNKFIVKRNNTICVAPYSKIENLIPDIASLLISNILNGVEARSDKERILVSNVLIRGPCTILNLNNLILFTKNYKHEKINLYQRQC